MELWGWGQMGPSWGLWAQRSGPGKRPWGPQTLISRPAPHHHPDSLHVTQVRNVHQSGAGSHAHSYCTGIPERKGRPRGMGFHTLFPEGRGAGALREGSVQAPPGRKEPCPSPSLHGWPLIPLLLLPIQVITKGGAGYWSPAVAHLPDTSRHPALQSPTSLLNLFS